MSWLYSIIFAGLALSSGGDSQQTLSNNAVTTGPAISAEMLIADESEKFAQAKPRSKTGNVSVSNGNGSIYVEAWDRDEVEREATEIADSKETLDDVDIKVEPSGHSCSGDGGYNVWEGKD